VLNKVPSSVQSGMRLMAPARAAAELALEAFAEKYGAKYARAVDCLIKDRADLAAFYDFPAEHWVHLRITNPIESCSRRCGTGPWAAV
jgi:putative transposase